MSFGAALGPNSLLVVKSLCAYLGRASVVCSEGLFRLSADSEHVDQWAARLDADPRADVSSIADPNLVAALLKRFLRLLSPPLLTYDLYEAFIEAAQHDERSVVLSKLCACVMKLPPLNHDILAELLQVLQIVMEHSDTNRMHVDNLATVFAPCLISRSPPDVLRMSEETQVVQQLLRAAPTLMLLERVGAAPRDTGDTSSVFVGVRLLHNPNFSSSPVLTRRTSMHAREANSPAANSPSLSLSSPAAVPTGSGSKRQILAYAKYDYKGSQAADSLTVARGEAVTITELPSDDNGRWCRCVHRESSEEGWVPTAFLDCPALSRAPLGRERALSRAGSSGNALPATSPLRGSGGIGSSSSAPRHVDPPPRAVSLNRPVGTAMSAPTTPAKSLDEMSDRLDILSRALIREKEERMQLEKRLHDLLKQK